MRKRLRERIAWAHPEWWALALSVAAWARFASARVGASAAAHEHGATTVAFNWILMVVAMMFPLAVGSIQATAARSMWRRRHRAVAWWLFGYLAPWSLLGALLALLVSVFVSEGPAPSIVIAPSFVAAAIWQSTQTRARAVSGCHRTQPLAPTGWRANYDCFSYGWLTGLNCVTACGALMVACSLLGHGLGGLVAMITATVIGLTERYAIRPNRHLLASAVGVHAIVVAAFVP